MRALLVTLVLFIFVSARPPLSQHPIMGITGSFEGYVTAPLYLYNNGVWSNLQTPGSLGDGKEEPTRIVFREQGPTYPPKFLLAYSCLKQLFPLDNYNFIKINVSYGVERRVGAPYIGIALSPQSTSNSHVASVTGAFGDGTAILDVSNIQGSYFIYFGMQWQSNGDAYGLALNQLYLTTV